MGGITSGQAAPLSLEPLSVQVADRIRSDILAGVFQPGQAMRIQAVAARYGVSTTPAREALRFLAAEGLLDYGPRKAVRVAVLSLADAEDIYAARLYFEPEALRRGMEAATPEWQAELTDAFEAVATLHDVDASSTEWATAHRVFHRTLVSACPSPWWRRTTDALANDADHCRTAASVDVPPQLSVGAHRRLYEAAIAGDVDKAVGLLTRHFERALGRIKTAREAHAE